jgi:hypothetical protein
MPRGDPWWSRVTSMLIAPYPSHGKKAILRDVEHALNMLASIVTRGVSCETDSG